MSSVLDAQAIISRGQAKKAGRKGFMALAKKAGLGKRVQNLAGKAGEYAGGYAAGKAREQVKKLIGYEKGGVIVLKRAGAVNSKGKARKAKK